MYIFGAKRGNHGYYQVSLDGEDPQTYDGFAGPEANGTDGIYQVVRNRESVILS